MTAIGILGGTFDPPHIGHVMIADEVKHSLQLDEVWFIPTNKPPHKSEATSNNAHRLAMLKKAIENTSYFKINDIEMERSGKSYTFDTMKMLCEQYPDYQFYFIIGADMVEYLPNWYRIKELMKIVQFVGVKRPNYMLDTDYPIIEVPVPEMDISSAEIRKRIQNGESYKKFINDLVYQYIKEEKLYG